MGVGTGHSSMAVMVSGTASTTPTTGTVVMSGGVGITGNLNVSGNINGTASTASYLSNVYHMDYPGLFNFLSTSYSTQITFNGVASHTYLFNWAAVANGPDASGSYFSVIFAVFVNTAQIKLYQGDVINNAFTSFTDSGSTVVTAGQTVTLQAKTTDTSGNTKIDSVSMWMIPIA